MYDLYYIFRTLGRGQIVRAVGGKTNNKEAYCQFPFWHDGIEYKNCAATKSPAGRSDHRWCSLTKNWQGKWVRTKYTKPRTKLCLRDTAAAQPCTLTVAMPMVIFVIFHLS